MAVETTLPSEREGAVETEQEQVPSLRKTIEAAFDKAAPEEPVEQGQEPVEKPPVEKPVVTEKVEMERVRDPDTGRFVEKPKQPAPVTQPQVQAKPVPAPKPGVKESAPSSTPVPVPVEKAPQAWKALAREHWAKLDMLGDSGKVIKEELVRREREVNQRLAQDAPARELAENFTQMVEPFLPLIPPGKHPLESIYGLMQTAAVLQTGTMQQRAAIAANIIKGYGVDIDLLAQALDGQNVPQAGRPAQGGYDPRVDQLVAELRQRDAQQQAYLQQQEEQEFSNIEASYVEFSKTHEFFDDVRSEMADLIRLRADRGLATSDEEAYNMAVASRPDIQEALRQREEVERATNPNGSTAQARRAAVSIKPAGAPRTVSVTPASDLHGTIEAAWDHHANKGKA